MSPIGLYSKSHVFKSLIVIIIIITTIFIIIIIIIVGRIRRPRGLGTMEEHRQSSSKMTLFPFATQATERVPGASIEKPRVWVINLAAYLRCRPMGVD